MMKCEKCKLCVADIRGGCYLYFCCCWIYTMSFLTERQREGKTKYMKYSLNKMK